MREFFKHFFQHQGRISLLLIIFFICSVAWRCPGFYTGPYPASVPYTQVMQTANIWAEYGPAEFHFGAVQSYPHTQDAFVHHYDRFLDHKGRNYYISYPPLVFWGGYGIRLLTGPDHLHAGLLIFNLMLHLLSMWGLYVFFRDTHSRIAFFIACLWLVLPVTLDIFYRVFFSEAITTALFAWLPFLIKKVSHPKLSQKSLWIWATYSFALAYNDWLGATIASSVGLALLIRFPQHFKTIISGWLAVVLAISLFVWQYSSLASTHELMDALLFRYNLREHFQAITVPWQEAIFSTLWYAFGWGLSLILLLILFLIPVLQKPQNRIPVVLWTFAIGLPLLLNLYFFFTFSVHHAYNFARWVPWLGIALGWIAMQFPRMQKTLPILIGILALLNLPIHFTRLEAMVWEDRMISIFPDFEQKAQTDLPIYVQLHGFKGDVPGAFGFKMRRSIDEVFRPEEVPVKAYLDGKKSWQFLDVAAGKPVVQVTYLQFQDGWLHQPARCLGAKAGKVVSNAF